MLNDLLKRDFVFFDNANGWIMLKNGLKPGQRPDIMNITAPDLVESLQKMAVEAGSDIICTNTFGANAKTLKGSGYSVAEIINAAIRISKRAAGGKALTAYDIGPIGEFISPFGSLSFEESYELYREQAVLAEKAGADLIVVETMSDLMEVKAAMLAVKENTKLPLFVMMTFDKSGRSFTGCKPESFAITAEGLGAAAIGINCSLAPCEIFPIAERLAKNTKLPIIVKPNAGLPNSVTGGYDIDAEEFARQMRAYAALGVKIVGGCCGTSSDYIAALRETFRGLKPAVYQKDEDIRICTPLQIESISSVRPEEACVGAGVLPDEIIEHALDQSDRGVKIITVRLPAAITPCEAADVVKSIQNQTDKPLYLVSDNLTALSDALRSVNGTAAVSCAGCGQAELQAVAAKYGAAII